MIIISIGKCVNPQFNLHVIFGNLHDIYTGLLTFLRVKHLNAGDCGEYSCSLKEQSTVYSWWKFLHGSKHKKDLIFA
jgi:hypothetical protein